MLDHAAPDGWSCKLPLVIELHGPLGLILSLETRKDGLPGLRTPAGPMNLARVRGGINEYGPARPPRSREGFRTDPVPEN